MVTIDGKEAHKVENKDPRTFKDVKVFAGDNFYIASDASYKNLVWENGKEDLNVSSIHYHPYFFYNLHSDRSWFIQPPSNNNYQRH